MLSKSNTNRDFAGTPRSTRRALLQGALAGVVIVGGAGSAAFAQVKARQSLVQYQEKPRGDQECDKCVYWAPPDACKLVEGKIGAKAWCALYVPRPK